MNAKVRCCCDEETQEVARYVEVEPVISIPPSSYMYDNTKFFVDLGNDEELSGDLLLYEGGSASTAQIPVRLGYLETFVPDRVRKVRFADGEVDNGNLKDINALKHRGWRIKTSGLKFSQSEYFTGDFSDMTRIEMSLPGTQSDDLIQQVDEGGFYFLGGTFSQTPALVQSREGLDQDGEPTTYLVAYNPRRECSRPEQARAYNPNRLIFDFTSEFPDTITMEFRYKGNRNFPDESFDETISRTYQKFVAGSGTFPLIEQLPNLNNPDFLTYPNVFDFQEESPDASAVILFGYRQVNCTEQREIPQRPGDYQTLSAPCMPVKVYSAGAGGFGHGPVGIVKYFTGDGGGGLANLLTDSNFQGAGFTRFLPHMSFTQVGVVLHDVTLGPDNPPLEENTDFSTFNQNFGSSAPFDNPPPVIPQVPVTAMSYKGGAAIDNFHTCSVEEAFKVFPRDRRGVTGTPPQNVTVRNVASFTFGTGDFPIVRLDSKDGSIGLEKMTNPLGGAYHYLTDGLSAGSQITSFNLPDVTLS